MALTTDELQSIVSDVLSSIRTNSQTIEDLTAVTTLEDDNYIEISGGKKVSYAVLRDLIMALVAEETDALETMINKGDLKSVEVTADESSATITISSSGTTISGSIPIATSSTAGIITAADKQALDEVQTTAADALATAEAAKAVTDTKGKAGGLAELDDNGTVKAEQLPSYVDDVLEFAAVVEGVSDMGDTDASSTDSGNLVVYAADIDRFLLAVPATASGDIEPVYWTEKDGKAVMNTDAFSFYCEWADGDTYGEAADDGRVPVSGKAYVNTALNYVYRYGGTDEGLVIVGTDLALGRTSYTAFPGDAGAALEETVATLATSDALADAVGSIVQFGGVATTSTVPDTSKFYLAEAGTYANFEIALTTAGVYAFVYEDSMWVAKQITDLSGYATTDYLSENYVFLDDYNEHLNAYEEVVESVAGKQDTLTAGDNISIENNVISATAEPATQADIIKALAEADAWRYDNSGYILVYKPDNDNLWYNERTESTTDKGVVGLTNARLISNPGNDNYTEFMVLNVPQPMPADCYLYFGRSSGMSYINTSHWDTSAVTSLSYTFYNCSGLTSLDVSGWDTSALTSLYCTFNGCSSLTVLDVSNWDTSSLAGIYLYRTFCGCSSLTSLDLSSWDTSKVTDIKECFRQCSSLTSITFGDGWDLSGCSSFQNLFYNCTSLTDISGSISGISYNLSLSACGTLTTDSLTVIINGLTDLTDSTSQTLTLNTASKANLTDELIELATSKNWSIS